MQAGTDLHGQRCHKLFRMPGQLLAQMATNVSLRRSLSGQIIEIYNNLLRLVGHRRLWPSAIALGIDTQVLAGIVSICGRCWVQCL